MNAKDWWNSPPKAKPLTEEAMNEFFEDLWKQDNTKAKAQFEEWYRKEFIKKFGYDPFEERNNG